VLSCHYLILRIVVRNEFHIEQWSRETTRLAESTRLKNESLIRDIYNGDKSQFISSNMNQYVIPLFSFSLSFLFTSFEALYSYFILIFSFLLSTD
jgi:hypothetical protein